MKVTVSVILIRAYCTRNNFPRVLKKSPLPDCGQMCRISLKLFYWLPLQVYKFTGESEYLLDQKECLRLGE